MFGQPMNDKKNKFPNIPELNHGHISNTFPRADLPLTRGGGVYWIKLKLIFNYVVIN